MKADHTYLPYRPEVTPPSRSLPAGACDCHFHVFKNEATYPYAVPRSYTPTPAPLTAYRVMARAAGLQRAVLVHPSVYGRDHRSFEQTLAACQGWMRGVAVVQPDTDQAQIERWHALGARGTRCNALFAGGTQLQDLPIVAERVRDLGWHLQLLIDVDEDATALSRVADLGMPVVVDHFGHTPPDQAHSGRGFANMLALVREGRVWVKLSGAYRISAQRVGYSDVAPMAAALLYANPARVLWGSDWPHPAIATPMPDDGHLVSTGFGFLVAQEQLATKLAAWLAGHFHEKWTMLLALNIGFFLLAAVMDEIAIMVILGPMLIAIANQFQVDPIHFGAMIVTNVAIGMAAPPIGYCLFVGMAISGLKLWPVARAILPFVAMMLVVLMLVTYVPAFALALVH